MRRVSRRVLGLVGGLLVSAMALPQTAAQAQVGPLCTLAGLPAGAGARVVQRSIFTAHGERWYCVVLPPAYAPRGPALPVLVALHGGSGSPQNLMDASRRIVGEGLRANGRSGYVMVFPTGLPGNQCNFAALPCPTNYWRDDANIDFLNLVLDEVAGLNVDRNRIFLAGFSGGASLIYRMIAANRISQPIKGVATMAGAIGMARVSEGMGSFFLYDVPGGRPMHAMIAQSEGDPKMKFGGGLSDGNSELHVSHSFKVDMFRVLTGNQAAPGRPFPMPGGASATRYAGGTHQVVSVSHPTTPHRWPEWLAEPMFGFFDSL